MSDIVEFYDSKSGGLLASVQSSMLVSVGQFINIRGVTWAIKRVTFALDHVDDLPQKRMRCNVDLKKA